LVLKLVQEIFGAFAAIPNGNLNEHNVFFA